MNLSQFEGQLGRKSPLARGTGRGLTARAMGGAPWLLIAGLLYAGLFIKPEAAGSAVVPPSIERRDLLLGVAVQDNTVWLAGNFGKILRSDDGKGEHWTVQVTGTEEHLQDIDAWDKDHAVAVGNGGTILVTTDGGGTWQPIVVELSEVANKLMRVKTGPDQGEAWAVGEMGAILHSTDFGRHWALMRPAEDVIMSDIEVSNPDDLLVVGEYGRMFHSRDHGRSWVARQSPSAASLTAIRFRDRLHGVAVGLDGALLWTADGGGTWNAVPPSRSGNVQHLFGVSWDPARGEWLAGQGSLGGRRRRHGPLRHRASVGP